MKYKYKLSLARHCPGSKRYLKYELKLPLLWETLICLGRVSSRTCLHYILFAIHIVVDIFKTLVQNILVIEMEL